MTKFRMRQAWTIARIEMRRAFLSKRAFWVYLLALLPAVIFIGHGIEMKFRESRYQGRGVTPAEVLNSFTVGEKVEDVLKRAPKPVEDHGWHFRRPKHDEDEDARREEEAERNGKRFRRESEEVEGRMLAYYDGQRRLSLHFENGVMTSKNSNTVKNFEEDRTIFAAVFQYFYLRLAIFFGCLGIFMNLFRGEMLDKTLHYWFLAPARREVLLVGKYLAGLVAATVIFTGGALLGFSAMLWPYSGAEMQAFWGGAGPAHLFWYAAAAALGCVGYGSVFLAAGLLLRNPIIPAAVLLVWESINGFLPDLLQKLSILHYLQSMCPVPAPIESDTPALLRLILSPAAPSSRGLAVLGLMAVTLLVLWAASRAVKRIEINYGTE
jgi:ABC-type transport system involved in multi-copper enzyme maturation permease subunit